MFLSHPTEKYESKKKGQVTFTLKISVRRHSTFPWSPETKTTTLKIDSMDR